MTACPERLEDLSADLDAALPPDAAAELSEHLTSCPGCRAEREALEHAATLVRSLPRVAPAALFAAEVMARLDGEPAVARRADGAGPATADPFADDPLATLPELPAPGPTRPAPAHAGAPEGACAELAAELSAGLDGVLVGAAAGRLEAHLAGCATCRLDRAALARVVERVRGLPRVRPSPLFVPRVMARLSELELDERRRALQARSARGAWWQRFAFVARAAGFLVVVGAGMSLTSPRTGERAVARAPWSSRATRAPVALPFSPRTEAASADDAAPAGPGAARAGRVEAAPAPLPPGPPADATWELAARGGDADAVEVAVREAAARAPGARVELARREPGRFEAWVAAPASAIEGLLAALDATEALDATDAARAAADGVAAAHDRVVLKSGFVLAGAVESRDARELVLRVGPEQVRVPARTVERVEPASARRRVRLVVVLP